ncbi:MAG: hypothetical protein WC052_01500 [Patescibacteria group bacterium]|jgi:sporulation protein YlmC with PRC-barrel domain
MATLPAKALLGLPVETQSGTRLGIIKNFDIDVALCTVVRFYVAPRLPKPFQNERFIITPAQVVAIERQRMVVFDAVSREGLPASATGISAPAVGA